MPLRFSIPTVISPSSSTAQIPNHFLRVHEIFDFLIMQPDIPAVMRGTATSDAGHCHQLDLHCLRGTATSSTSIAATQDVAGIVENRVISIQPRPKQPTSTWCRQLGPTQPVGTKQQPCDIWQPRRLASLSLLLVYAPQSEGLKDRSPGGGPSAPAWSQRLARRDFWAGRPWQRDKDSGAQPPARLRMEEQVHNAHALLEDSVLR